MCANIIPKEDQLKKINQALIIKMVCQQGRTMHLQLQGYDYIRTAYKVS